MRDFEIFATKPKGPVALELPRLPRKACEVEVHHKPGVCLATQQIALAGPKPLVSIRIAARVRPRIARDPIQLTVKGDARHSRSTSAESAARSRRRMSTLAASTRRRLPSSLLVRSSDKSSASFQKDEGRR